MATCKAWTFTKRGSPPDILTLVDDHPVPTLPPPVPLPKAVPQPEEWLVIKTAYAGLNIGTIFHMSLIPVFARAKTCVADMEFSGTVTDVWHPEPGGTAAPRFSKGDKVAAFIPIGFGWPTGTGSLAEYVAIPARYAVKKAEEVSMVEASGASLGACTAWQQCVDAGLKKGDRVLVNGASGGVGSMALQMARDIVGKDGFVVGICSERNLDLVKSLGADEVIDYLRHKRVTSELIRRYSAQPFDAVIDCIGVQHIYTNSASYLKPEGIYSAVGIKPPSFAFGAFARAVFQMQLNALWPLATWLGGTGRRWKGVAMMDPPLEMREMVMGMLAEKRIRVLVDSVRGFGEVVEGYAVVTSLRAKGKVVVKVDEGAEE